MGMLAQPKYYIAQDMVIVFDKYEQRYIAYGMSNLNIRDR